MKIEELGWNSFHQEFLDKNTDSNFQVGRVIAVHRERYILRTTEADLEAEITGNLRYSAASAADLPIVGDWVTHSVFDGNFSVIHGVLPRRSIIERQAVNKSGEKQPIAANVDYSYIIQAVDHDFNVNRLERYLAITSISGIKPVLLLSKTDLIDPIELDEKTAMISKRHPDLQILPFSNIARSGYREIEKSLIKSLTYCFLGSSGVGKSTLINHLLGEELMKTSAISSSTGKGKHTTSHRELFILKNGSLVIDTPGMREVGIVDSVDVSFDTITRLSGECRFSDCTHTMESGCAILGALEEGNIDEAAYNNYIKMQKEAAHFQSTLAERRKKDKKFGKIYKQVMSYKKKNK